jgi:hypothetical protein
MAEVNGMYSFDEMILLGELDTLSNRSRIAFAAAAASRQLASYERITNDQHSERNPRVITTHLWVALRAGSIDHAVWSSALEEVLSLLPEEGNGSTIEYALVDDALSSLAYAIRCLLKPEPQEAAWAARRAYEAADQAAICSLGVQARSTEMEAVIKAHVFVQRELARQRNDLLLLREDSLDEVQRLALHYELLTDQDAATLRSKLD